MESAAAIWGSLNVLLGGRGPLNPIRDGDGVTSDREPLFIHSCCVPLAFLLFTMNILVSGWIFYAGRLVG